ncbi:DNA/RNA non-specific endonuclease, partial [Microbacterium amylolyticum]
MKRTTRTIRKRVRRALISIAATAVVAAVAWVAVPSIGAEWLPELSDIVGGAPTIEQVAIAVDGDYYTVDGAAEVLYAAEPGDVAYCPVDQLDRATCAYGVLTSELRQAAADRGREDITVDPAGWPAENGEVTIPARADVDGSTAYSGWLWNRSHLLADSLGGAASRENLVTGTRTQNVGSTRADGVYAGGMAYTEKIARDYLDTGAGDACPLYYAATPQYHGDELIPRAVHVDVRSCDGEIDMRVNVTNAAAGCSLNYVFGT